MLHYALDTSGAVVDALERAPHVVVPLVRAVPAAILKRRPSPRKWSAHEHACHLAVVHEVFFRRLDQMLDGPQPVIAPYEPGLDDPDDRLLSMDLETAIESYVQDRRRLVSRLRQLTAADWARSAEHGEYSHYSVLIMFRHLALHDFFHAYRIEALLLKKQWPSDTAIEDLERDLLLEASERASAYLALIRNRRVTPTPEALDRLPELGGSPPEAEGNPFDVLRLLDTVGSPATVANSGGRYFGFVNGGALPVTRAAAVPATAWDQNAALRVMSPVAAALEEICLAWLTDLLGLPSGCGGAFVTGATMANFACLAAARHDLLSRAGWDVEAKGLFGAPPIDVVVSDEVHLSVLKALGLLGFGRERVVRVPTDAQGRLRSERMPRLTDRTVVCTQAGNVNTGAFDPLEAVCDAVGPSGAWVHVDGAFGLWAAACPARAHLTRGIDRAHSWATDAHKWLNVPYDCGIALVRHGDALRSATQMQAPYLASGSGREPMHWTPEASRRARAVEVWAALRTLGRAGLAALIERTCEHARRFADALTAGGATVLNDVVLNQVLVAFSSDAHTQDVIARLQRDSVCWFGGTVWRGQTAMRISVSSWATTDADVERSVRAIVDAAGAWGGEHEGSRLRPASRNR